MTSFALRKSAMCGSSRRATTSTPEPAGKPMSTVIGWLGQAWASAMPGKRKARTRRRASREVMAGILPAVFPALYLQVVRHVQAQAACRRRIREVFGGRADALEEEGFHLRHRQDPQGFRRHLHHRLVQRRGKVQLLDVAPQDPLQVAETELAARNVVRIGEKGPVDAELPCDRAP